MTTSLRYKRIFSFILTGLIIVSGWIGTPLPKTHAQAGSPQITNVSIKNNTLAVKGRNFSGDAKIEIDGSALADGKSPNGVKLKSKQGGALAAGSYIVTVRNGATQRSAPFLFDNQTTQVPKVTLSIISATLRVPVGTTVQLTATARDAAGGELTGVAFTWKSGNPSVATVDATGLVKGIGAGTSSITVSALRNEFSVDVTVEGGGNPGDAASVAIVPASPVINEGDTLQLRAEVRDAAGNLLPNAPVTWSSDNDTQVSVDSNTGLAKAVKRGFAAVTAQSGTVQKTVSVAAVKVESGNALPSGGPGEVRVDLANRVYQSDLAEHVIRRGDFGKPLQVYSGAMNSAGDTDGTLTQARYNGPLGIGIDNQGGMVYIADTANQVVRAIRPDGKVFTLTGVAGQSGYRDGPLEQALFRSPRGTVVGGDGNIYVADGLNHVIRKIDVRKRTVSTLAGLATPEGGVPGLADGAGSAARFNQPQSLALDANNRNLVVADTVNGRVRLVTLEGQVTTLGFISKGSGKSRRGAVAPLAGQGLSFVQPHSISVDGIGTIYVADEAGVHVISRQNNAILGVVDLAETTSLGSVSGVAVTSVEGNFAGGTRATAVVVNSQVNGNAQLMRVTVGVPMINALSSDSVPLGSRLQIVATGVNFTPDVQLFLDGVPVTDLKVDKSTQLSFTTPLTTESGIRTLTVQGRGGSRQRAFFVAPPSVGSLNVGGITTLVGGTTFVGDGGDALTCTLAGPGGLAVGKNGDLLVMDRINNRARRVDVQTNIISTFAGTGALGSGGDGGPAISAGLGNPEGVAVDFDGNIFISDSDGARVRRVDAQTGRITTYGGSVRGFGGDGGLATQANMGSPAGLTVDDNGHLFIADPDNHRIRRVDAQTGIMTTVAGDGQPGFSGDGGPAGSAHLNHPTDVAMDHLGNLFIADEGNNRIRRVDAKGSITTIAGSGQTNGIKLQDKIKAEAAAVSLNSPHSLEFQNSGVLLIADTKNHCIRSLAIDLETGEAGLISTIAGQEGKAGFAGDDGDATQALFNEPTHVAADGAGNIFVSDSLNNRIRIIEGDPGNGNVHLVTTHVGTGSLDLASSTDGVKSRLYYPAGLQFDRQGNLYVCEPLVGRVRRLDAFDQTLATFAGKFDLDEPAGGNGAAALDASLLFPANVAVNSVGNVFIVDQQDGSIRMVDALTRAIQAFAGTPGGSPGDGAPAARALLAAPSGAVFGPDGNLYFADLGSHRVRRVVTTTNIVETVAGTGRAGFSGDAGPALAAELSAPSDVAFDTKGNLYIADAANNRIRRVERVDSGNRPDLVFGRISTVAGTGKAEYNGDNILATSAGLNNPVSIAIDGADKLVIADNLNHRVRLVNLATSVITTLAGKGTAGMGGDGDSATNALVNSPVDVAVDSNGNLLISDQLNSRVRLVKGALTPPKQ